MRALLLSALVLAVAVPVGWAASSPPGTLSIESGRGTAVLTGKGIVIGRLDKGDLKIVDLSPLDQWSPRVNGVPRGKTVGTRGKNVNFYVPGGRYKITVKGEGFSISARGQGTVTVTGNPDAAGATGTYALGDGNPSPIPSTSQTLSFGSTAPEGPTTKAVSP
jgi:hypothetical protein